MIFVWTARCTFSFLKCDIGANFKLNLSLPLLSENAEFNKSCLDWTLSVTYTVTTLATLDKHAVTCYTWLMFPLSILQM